MSEFAALIMSLSTSDSTLRMRLWRTLKEAGCGILRDGVYLLPASTRAYESFANQASEVHSYGGFAMTLTITARSDAQVVAIRKLFDRSADYGELVRRVAKAKASLAQLGSRRAQTEIRRLERALQRLVAIDFYAGEARAQAISAIQDVRAEYRGMSSRGEPRLSRRSLRRVDTSNYQGRVWATRKSPWVDRLASAWLIKRFIDRGAQFAWIERPSQRPKGAVGFDFDGADFTHVGNRVTFEVLVAAFDLGADSAIASIGAAVHFLDIGGIPVPDAKGLETILKGARDRARTDDALLADSMRAFDLLYSGYRTG